jgi:hypothetical protein
VQSTELILSKPFNIRKLTKQLRTSERRSVHSASLFFFFCKIRRSRTIAGSTASYFFFHSLEEGEGGHSVNFDCPSFREEQHPVLRATVVVLLSKFNHATFMHNGCVGKTLLWHSEILHSIETKCFQPLKLRWLV